MPRENLQIRVELDYEEIKALERQAREKGISRTAVVRRFILTGLSLQRLLKNPALFTAISELTLKSDPASEIIVRQLIQKGLAGD
jgi:hypothetical protein